MVKKGFFEEPNKKEARANYSIDSMVATDGKGNEYTPAAGLMPITEDILNKCEPVLREFSNLGIMSGLYDGKPVYYLIRMEAGDDGMLACEPLFLILTPPQIEGSVKDMFGNTFYPDEAQDDYHKKEVEEFNKLLEESLKDESAATKFLALNDITIKELRRCGLIKFKKEDGETTDK